MTTEQPVWQWPVPRNLGGDAMDDLCCWCHEWASTRSSHAQRYNQIQGKWLDTPPLARFRVRPDDEGVATVQICDTCTRLYGYIDGFASSTEILVLGRRFLVDCMYRMND